MQFTLTNLNRQSESGIPDLDWLCLPCRFAIESCITNNFFHPHKCGRGRRHSQQMTHVLSGDGLARLRMGYGND